MATISTATRIERVHHAAAIVCLIIGGAGAAGQLHPAASGPAPHPDALVCPVNPNRDPAWMLEELPGIGRTRAAAIVAYRADQPRPAFGKPADLTAVPGIGRGTVARLKNRISCVAVGPQWP